MIMVDQLNLPRKDMLYKLITLPDIRFLRCDIKSLNLLPNVLASQAAKEAGCDEAVLHRNGIVSECAHSNLFYLKDQVLYTAPFNFTGNYACTTDCLRQTPWHCVGRSTFYAGGIETGG